MNPKHKKYLKKKKSAPKYIIIKLLIIKTSNKILKAPREDIN